MLTETSEQWAKEQFGHAELGDPRRTRRLVLLASSIAQSPGNAVSNLSLSPAEMEGAYRFIRNDQIEPEAIAEAGYQATAKRAKEHSTLLALEDTTTLSYRHASVKEELGHISDKETSRGLLAHSILLFAPEEQSVVGLIEQQRWSRDIKTKGKKHQRAKRAYKEKESYKWETASEHMKQRLGDIMSRTISVCDREADVYEYLHYKVSEGQRFVVRSMHNRHLEEKEKPLYELSSDLVDRGQRTVSIAQRGGKHARAAREVTLEVRSASVVLKSPNKKSGQSLPMYYIQCTESGHQEGALCWHLLTSEPVESQQEAFKVLEYYERRWLIEDYHKAWKTGGTEVEKLRMQSSDNLERLAVILAFLATRILQLRFIKTSKISSESSCDTIVSGRSWKLLWLKLEKKPLPEKAPNSDWLYRSLATLAGWKDSKRTGRASCQTLWQGWFKLQMILEGYELARALEESLD